AAQGGAAGALRSGAAAVTAQAVAPRRSDTQESVQRPAQALDAGRAPASQAPESAEAASTTTAVDVSVGDASSKPAHEEHETHAAPASSATGRADHLREPTAGHDSSAAAGTAASMPQQATDGTVPAPADRASDLAERNLTAGDVAEAGVVDGATESAAASVPASTASASSELPRQPRAADVPSTQSSTQQADEPRRASGASAALDVLRNAGLKVSGERSRPASGASAKAAPDVPPKPAAPRVVVPTPNPTRRAQQPAAAPARDAVLRANSSGATVPPWEDIPPDAPGALDDYVPASADDAFFAPPDDSFAPVFDIGHNDVRVSPAAAPAVDTRPLPPAVPLDALGFDRDWPALAASLPLKGISYQLAFNSELMALDGATLKLNVPVPQYADAAQVAKLKAALAERLAQPVEVVVEVGPARRTAAALDAAERAQRQQEAEREIGSDPFVQSLIREFGASIVPGSVRPLMPAAPGPDAASAAH
ncbi:DNA polymerase III subunit gamma/tau C-terminal domain-containing protein, partial [Paraburkholderia humisilvae]